MGGGLNKGTNRKIAKIKDTIKKNNLDLIYPVYRVDNLGNAIPNAKQELRDEIINDIREVKGNLQFLTYPTAPRTNEKKKEYIAQIQDLSEIETMLNARKKGILNP